MFEGIATSSASANGLMQIIPDTGQWIATQLRWPSYQQRDLYRPLVSIKFGVYYLSAAVSTCLAGNMIAAWAGYNGGPTRAANRLKAVQGDIDLFVEEISIAETRLYIERLREYLAMYQRLYGQ